MTDFQKMESNFKTALHAFISQTDDMDKNKLVRVCKALAAYPLEEQLVKLSHQKEVDLYNLGVEIQAIKLNMMVESLRLDAVEEQRKANLAKVPNNIEKPDYAKEGE
jgi:hypothetical protein